MTDAGAARDGAPVDRVPDVEELTRVVALDGPAGSGKSTVARLTAQALGWRFVDTGATYRAVTLHVLRSGVALDDAVAVTRAAESARVVLDVDAFSTRVELNGEDVSTKIRGPEVTAAVSAVSAVPGVRHRLVLLQRQLMGTEGAVVEGRDISTVVAPLAGVKVYLDAREEVRARRRAADHAGAMAAAAAQAADQGAPQTAPQIAAASSRAAGLAAPTSGSPDSGGVGLASAPPPVNVPDVDLAAVQADIRRRDALDNQTNKLEVSEGAIHLDTSDLTLQEVVDAVVRLVQEAGLAATGMSR